ncbi:hypothetical protein NC652_022397 [Populus alba x Populus x berolinensis]|nr:hypothetical protein NC652_022397 [Populus alba x Populus x berolinensis]
MDLSGKSDEKMLIATYGVQYMSSQWEATEASPTSSGSRSALNPLLPASQASPPPTPIPLPSPLSVSPPPLPSEAEEFTFPVMWG